MESSNHLGLTESISEALRNARSRWVLALTIATIVGVLSGGVTLFTILESNQIETLHETQIARGKNVFLAVASPGQSIDATACEKLADQVGVISSGSRKGAIRDLSGAHVAQGVTPGYIRTVWPEYRGSGSIIAGEKYAREHLLVTGSKSQLAIDVAQVDTVAPVLLRDPRVNDELLVTQQATGTVRECFVAAESGAAAGVSMLVPSWFSPTTVAVSPVYRVSGEVNPQELLSARLGITVSVIAGLVSASALIFSWLIRRSDFALYRLLGLRNREVLVMLIVDACTFGLLPMMMASAWVVAFCAKLVDTPLVLSSLLYASGIPPLGIALAIPIGALLMLQRDPHSHLREGS